MCPAVDGGGAQAGWGGRGAGPMSRTKLKGTT